MMVRSGKWCNSVVEKWREIKMKRRILKKGHILLMLALALCILLPAGTTVLADSEEYEEYWDEEEDSWYDDEEEEDDSWYDTDENKDDAWYDEEDDEIGDDPVTTTGNTVDSVAIFRLYNPNSGEHFFTSNQTERDNLILAGWKGEGYAWVAPVTSDVPVYRLYNPNTGDHHYTYNTAEQSQLIQSGWRDEGSCWYSAGLTASTDNLPVLRQYNPNCTGAGSHNYTINGNEAQSLVTAGWRDEGAGWYGLNLPFPEYPEEPYVPEPEPQPEPQPTPVVAPTDGGGTSYGGTYVLNKNTGKFHYANCPSVKQMKESNKIYSDESRDVIISKGYTPCRNCRP